MSEIRNNIIANCIWLILVWGVSKTANIPPIPVPFWFFVLPVGAIASWFYLRHKRKELIIIADKDFGTERVTLDGKKFIRCRFRNTELVIRADEKWALDGNDLQGIKVTFEGPANLAISTLAAFYRDPAMRPIAESYFELIKKGPSST